MFATKAVIPTLWPEHYKVRAPDRNVAKGMNRDGLIGRVLLLLGLLKAGARAS
jgi:hypothetical protein